MPPRWGLGLGPGPAGWAFALAVLLRGAVHPPPPLVPAQPPSMVSLCPSGPTGVSP